MANIQARIQYPLRLLMCCCFFLPGAFGDTRGGNDGTKLTRAQSLRGSLIQMGKETASSQALDGIRAPMDGGAMVTMVGLLIVVPIVTALVAFAFVETRSRTGASSTTGGLNNLERNGYGGAWLENTLRTPDSLAPAASRQFLHPASVSMAGSLPRRTFTASGLRGGSLDSPSLGYYPFWGRSLSAVGTIPSLPQPGNYASPTMHEVRPNLPGSEKILDPARVSPLSTGMMVKNPAGVVVRLDGRLTPHAQNRKIDVLSVKDGGNDPVLTAYLNEAGGSLESSPAASVKLFAKAQDGPIATMDTRTAVYAKGGIPSASEKRYVIVHSAGEYDKTGPACAQIESARGRCLVHFLGPPPQGYGSTQHDTRTLGLTVYMVGSCIDYMVDARGQVVVKAEGSAADRPLREDGALWVRVGTDLALVVCTAIAVQKLAVSV